MNKVANELLKIKAVFFNTKELFTWASGIKSPIYTDNRIIVSYPEARKIIEKELANLVIKKFKNVDCIVGTATAGISHAAYVSNILNLPMAYVRSKPKDHGRKQLLEGYIKPKAKVVVIEDLLSTGSSSIETVLILRKLGFNVLGVVSIFTYNTKKCSQNFKEANCKHFSTCTLDELIVDAIKIKYITKEESKQILSFRDSLK